MLQMEKKFEREHKQVLKYKYVHTLRPTSRAHVTPLLISIV
jgi:hypothetical protein